MLDDRQVLVLPSKLAAEAEGSAASSAELCSLRSGPHTRSSSCTYFLVHVDASLHTGLTMR